MKKLKIYLDTSVISMLDTSMRGIITKEFFNVATQNDHELVISEIVNLEIKDAELSKREQILYFLGTLNYQSLPYTQESHNLAWNYVIEGVLTHNHIDDLLHVAYATVHNCDMIVSWNRKHIAKPSKIQKLNFCNIKNNYHSITICTPEEFLIHFI
jgi:predicted nucleic acid-binding protein